MSMCTGLFSLAGSSEGFIGREGNCQIPRNSSTLGTMHSIIEYSDDQHRQQVVELRRTVFGYGATHNSPGLSIDKKLAVHDGLFFLAQDECHVVGTEQALIHLGCGKIHFQIHSDNPSVTAFYESFGYAVDPRVSLGNMVSNNVLHLDASL